MNSEVSIYLPKLGESIVSATIVKWLKKKGDIVGLDEPILEVATDKVNSEIPSPVAGVLHEVFVQEEEEVLVGALLATITLKSSEINASKMCPLKPEQQAFLSPAVQHLIKAHNLTSKDIEKIVPTGYESRVTKRDVENFLSKKTNLKDLEIESYLGGFEKIKMSPTRKAIAETMVRSKSQIPHASLITSIDVTTLVKFIEKNKEEFFQKFHAKLTITAFVAKALQLALMQYPLLNATLDGDFITIKKSVHLGIAVNVDDSVLVPVISSCEKKNITEIATAISDLAKRAKQGSLKPQDTLNGTITLTNFGSSGIEIGIPIIKHPEVAILALGAVSKKVVVRDEDKICIASICELSLTFDHRAFDGMYACNFLSALKKSLEHPCFDDCFCIKL